MCGRFSLAADIKTVASRFDAGSMIAKWKPSYNIAPTQTVPVVLCEQDKRTLVGMAFGFIPHWAKEKQTGYSMINAKAETLAQKPSFRQSFRNKRCLIPADGFYEWEQTDKGKLPYRIALKDDALFAFAGIWDSWTEPEGKTNNTFAIITTEANSLTKKLHDRMPVILQKGEEAVWLDPGNTDPEKLQPLLAPYPAKEMKLFRVSPLVNSWRYNNANCIKQLSQR